MKLPQRFEEILKKNTKLEGIVKYTLSQFETILKENNLYFFEEYTDHGISHINSVLNSSCNIITEKTFTEVLDSNSHSVGILILSILLHDIGMHLTPDGLNALIIGYNDDIRIKEIDSKTWRELWNEYLDEARRFGDIEKLNIIGNSNWIFRTPEIENKDRLNGEDKKLIGEFIRRNHPRIAHEISLKGFPVGNEHISFASELEYDLRDICGLIARSHGINIRNTFEYLENKFQETWIKPYNIEVIYLMVVLRIADYFQVDSSRTPDVTVKLKTFNSPISQIEHYKHLDVKFVQPYSKDPETLIMQCEPRNSFIYIKLKDLFADLQKELDTSWAIMGEIYGKENYHKQPKISYRRIKSNIDNFESFSKKVNYIPEKIKFNVSNELPKLLIGPLYGNDPTFGIRELLQNSVDSCREREFLEKSEYEGVVHITIYQEDDKIYFKIEDNGLGMNLATIKNYFLEVGSSLRKSSYWKKTFTKQDGNSKIQRSGKFGIGVLASFLIGEKLFLETKDSNSKCGYSFSTDLNSEQIEITKIEKEFVGTKITIQINSQTIENLKKSKYPFYEWYLLDSPKVVFEDQTNNFLKLNNNIITPGFDEIIPKEWREFKHNDYNKIIWTYNTEILDKTTARMISNGILIPEATEFIKQYWDRKTSKWVEDIKFPFISVFDYNGTLPLNLSRNNLDNDILPFKNELQKDIYKDVIAKLMTEDIEFPFNDNEKISMKLFRHPSIGDLKIIFSKEGFMLDHNFFTRKKKDTTLLEFSPKKESKYLIPFDIKDSFILILENKNFSMTDYQYNANIYNYMDGAKIFLSNTVYNKIFDNNYNRYPLTVRKKHNKNNFNTKNVEIIYKYKEGKFNLAELDENMDLCNYIIESKLSEINYEKPFLSSHFFTALLTKYFKHTDCIIPYSLNDRKEKYSKLFYDLQHYIKKYST